MSPNGGPIARNDGEKSPEFGKSDARLFKAPPWLAASVAEFRPTEHTLDVIRPIRAFSFGGILVFLTLLVFLLGNSPAGQSALLVVALFGLPLSVAAWFVASRVERRLARKKNRIQRRMHGAGLHFDDDGRVLTDNPHPVLVRDTASGKEPENS